MEFSSPKRLTPVLCVAFCWTFASATVADPGEDEDAPIVTPCAACEEGENSGDPDDYDLTRPIDVSASVIVSLIGDLVRVQLGR